VNLSFRNIFAQRIQPGAKLVSFTCTLLFLLQVFFSLTDIHFWPFVPSRMYQSLSPQGRLLSFSFHYRGDRTIKISEPWMTAPIRPTQVSRTVEKLLMDGRNLEMMRLVCWLATQIEKNGGLTLSKFELQSFKLISISRGESMTIGSDEAVSCI
jgi:hypothetical protein